MVESTGQDKFWELLKAEILQMLTGSKFYNKIHVDILFSGADNIEIQKIKEEIRKKSNSYFILGGEFVII